MKEEKNNTDVKIEKIRVKDLYRYTLDYYTQRDPGDIDFISKQRALSHSNNPLAKDDDIGMIIATISGKCVGYLGMIPGIARIEGKDEEVFWLSCTFISPAARGKSISKLMVDTALGTHKPLFITGMSNMAEPIFIHLGFKYLPKAEFTELNFPGLRILPVRIIERVLRKILFFMYKKGTGREYADGMIYRMQKKRAYSRLLKKFQPDFAGMVFEEVSILDESFRDKIEIPENGFPRSLEWVNWMLRYRWVLGHDEAESYNLNYYFSNVRESFQYKAIKIASPGTEQKEGFLIFSISKDKGTVRMRVLDHFFESETEGRQIVAILLKYGQEIMADSIEITNDLMTVFNPGGYSKRLLTSREWRYIYFMEDMEGEKVKEIEKLRGRPFDGDISFV
jgi:hypothetical protein